MTKKILIMVALVAAAGVPLIAAAAKHVSFPSSAALQPMVINASPNVSGNVNFQGTALPAAPGGAAPDTAASGTSSKAAAPAPRSFSPFLAIAAALAAVILLAGVGAIVVWRGFSEEV